MTTGKLEKVFSDRTLSAEMGPDGWASADHAFADSLARAYPPGDRADGVAWIRAFHAAVDALGATITQEPEPDDEPPGTIH